MVSIVLASLAWFEMKTHLPSQHNESGFQWGGTQKTMISDSKWHLLLLHHTEFLLCWEDSEAETSKSKFLAPG